MAIGALPSGVRDWLRDSDWFPGQDIGSEADELVDIVVAHFRRQGTPLEPVQPAVDVLRSFGDLRLVHPQAPRDVMVMEPTVGYEGDAAAIAELAGTLGARLFPVGYDPIECGLNLVDEAGRFFHLHWSSGYFLGRDQNDMFERFLMRVTPPDAEDFFS
ncbi:SUKH-3 domain-containing protein [Actinomycetota bacterium Odt1-20B]